MGLDCRLVIRHVRYCSQNSPSFELLSKRRNQRIGRSGYQYSVPMVGLLRLLRQRRSGNTYDARGRMVRFEALDAKAIVVPKPCEERRPSVPCRGAAPDCRQPPVSEGALTSLHAGVAGGRRPHLNSIGLHCQRDRRSGLNLPTIVCRSVCAVLWTTLPAAFRNSSWVSCGSATKVGVPVRSGPLPNWATLAQVLALAAVRKVR